MSKQNADLVKSN